MLGIFWCRSGKAGLLSCHCMNTNASAFPFGCFNTQLHELAFLKANSKNLILTMFETRWIILIDILNFTV